MINEKVFIFDYKKNIHMKKNNNNYIRKDNFNIVKIVL